MQINAPECYRNAAEIDTVAELIDLRDARVLELGCGDARTTRALVERLGAAEVIATEVDRIQHDKNLALGHLPGVHFVLGGAEAIDAPEASFDAVLMFKSLHHVPTAAMPRALREIHRVLRPGGQALFSEPVYWGEFNALISLIHDEELVRQAAFDTLCQAVETGLFISQAEVFIQVPATYASWDVFASRYLNPTHTRLDLDDRDRARIRHAFDAHSTPTGAHFLKPQRIDVLVKPG
ncbi:MAG TPA: class I SAM-dependent methyltransferase [Chromatiaceae bacterium]|jgi:SAM-dependent methyltransferase|nr:MAG: hypothetical protein N838_05960 [Thiohalocapsa sp. PB-PSB1]QQO53019.1 MAG: class I SAM-dependent methyltransferase [Thiohalocapsa sp. PB-PSB1]HBG94189.1 class I SAM-dependent methyltransferase [Chromatiaceae bacterium]HCS90580.1 class I SAM-dependent methyltransferase [Chromatiaceae bacterium]